VSIYNLSYPSESESGIHLRIPDSQLGELPQDARDKANHDSGQRFDQLTFNMTDGVDGDSLMCAYFPVTLWVITIM
jgi:hypothetical protein